jgi:ribosomal protein S18 acetylase RimI-like enzyme
MWDGTRIIGQMEMLIHQTTPVRGYVNLFYLVPEARGQGVGATLHAYFLEFMRGGGAPLARLSVSPSNVQALAYYRKQGWSDLGPRPDDGTVHLMELHLATL